MDSSEVSTPPVAPSGAPESPTAILPTQPAGPAPVPPQQAHPAPPAPAPSAPPPIQSSAVQGGDSCPSCGAQLAADQRYCLACGQRRGDPRLPFMDAVVLMDAVKRPAQAPPPPPKKKRSGISPNAALITGVGVLLLALGIGVLIGRSGTHQTAAPAAPQIVTVHSSGGEEEATASSAKTTTGDKTKTPKSKKAKAAALKEAEAHPAAEEVLKPSAGVKLPPAAVQPGDKCEAAAAGCSKGGEFNGEFFGE
ncbi:MAG TPA: hypothetical protein VHU86_05915 [Solirubrobacterales bacterium]|nr:hypothetical protein [Solirubrobacterales bacterium]